MRVKHANQIHPPAPKEVRVDAVGNDKRKLWLKEKPDSKTTMPFYDGLNENQCKFLINAINTALISLGKKPMSKRFLITK